MTFIYELDLDIIEMHLYAKKMESVGQGVQKLEPEQPDTHTHTHTHTQTDRQTDRQTNRQTDTRD